MIYFSSSRKRHIPEELRDPRPQLIAEAIAAFARNNHLQRHPEEQTVESKVCYVAPISLQVSSLSFAL